MSDQTKVLQLLPFLVWREMICDGSRSTDRLELFLLDDHWGIYGAV